MAVRPIDANAMLNELRPVSFEAEHSAVLLSDVSKMMREWVERQPTLTPPNEWVSVDDELPETAGEYLVVYHPCYWDNVSAKICVGIDSFRGKTAWAKKKYQRVTHWMPLPAPPDRRPPEGEEDT